MSNSNPTTPETGPSAAGRASMQQAYQIVSQELAKTVNQARVTLEDAVEGRGPRQALDGCAGYLHEVSGVLKIVEVYGGALLAEEMEQTCRYLVSAKREQSVHDAALDALTRAMVQLPAYLERVQAGGRDVALVLLPILNDLRAARGQPLLSESTILLLNRTPSESVTVSLRGSDPSEDFVVLSRKVRPAFQLALLGLLKADGERAQPFLEKLRRMAVAFESAAARDDVYRLWWVVSGVLDALIDGGLPISVSVKRLLGQADRRIKKTIDEGLESFDTDPVADLLNSLLYYIARTENPGDRVLAIREAFGLSEPLPTQAEVDNVHGAMAKPSIALMQTVAAAIREDLSAVKDVLDIHVRTGETDASKLRPQVELLAKIGDTLGVLGLGEQRGSVLQEIERLQTMIDQEHSNADQDVLLTIASTLLKVESSLERHLTQMVAPEEPEETATAEDIKPGKDGEDLVDVRKALMRECIVNLARIKDTLTQTMEGRADAVAIDAVPALNDGIVSGFRMLELDRAADLFARLARFVRVYLNAANHTLASDHQDRLADALVSIEYYMETIAANRKEPGYMLDNAETCLLVLDDVRTKLEQPVTDIGAATQITTAPEFAAADNATIADGTEVIQSPVVTDDTSAIDPELLELFIEEAKDEVRNIRQLLPKWKSDTSDMDSLITVRRSFHTLKGSGRMVGAERIGEYCWQVENLLNRVINRTLSLTPTMADFVIEAAEAVPSLIEQLEVGTEPQVDVDLLSAKAQAFVDGDPDAANLTRASIVAESAPLEMDPVLHEIFAKEAEGHMAVVDDFLAKVKAPPARVSEALYRASHTLHGSINTAGLQRATPLSGALNQLVRRVHDGNAELDAKAINLLADALSHLRSVIRSVNTGAVAENLEPLVTQIEHHTAFLAKEQTQRLRPSDRVLPPGYEPTQVLDAVPTPEVPTVDETSLMDVPDYDPDIGEIFTEEAGEILEQVDVALERWHDTRDAGALSELKRYLHTLKGSANMAGIGSFGNLSHELETLLIALDDQRINASNQIDGLLRQCIDCLHEMRDTVLDGRLPAPRDDLGGTVRLVALGEPVPETIGPTPALQRGFAPDEMVDIPAAGEQASEASMEEEPTGVIDSDLIDVESLFESDDSTDEAVAEPETSETRMDDEETNVGEVLDEGTVTSAVTFNVDDNESEVEDDLGPHAKTQQWSDSPFRPTEETPEASTDSESASADESPLDETVAEFESDESNVVPFRDTQSNLPTIDPADSLIERSQFLEALIDDAAEKFSKTGVSASLDETIASDEVDAPADESLESTIDSPVDELPLDLPTHSEESASEPESQEVPDLPGESLPIREVARERTEFVRVDSRLLEDMLNAAGEVSIYHGRLSQQVSSIDFHLAELTQTVIRLRDQLRQLEIETEAQILHGHEDDRSRKDFDPLELDRYSKIQQLSRALAESSNDVDSLKGLLGSVTREADTLLTQQARVTAELQNGLMRTRMVPFERHVARLSRLVRQTAKETGKQAELAVEGAAGELDRQVLEKMLPPLEHMMRNAVVHGIETPDVRQAASKPAGGQITIRLHREGSEMVMDVADDGAGLNVDAIRRKGVERGLIADDDQSTDQAILDLILEPGFSTAEALTQAAGRGVGMDVVANEVKKLGGSLRIASMPGQGTNFTVRLPFTLAITQALIVRTGDEVFALPLPTVEGVTRVPRSEVEQLMTEAVPMFDYGEHSYRLRHLGPLVGGAQGRLAEDEQAAVPVILIRAGQHSTALLVDEMLTSREIVVKAVGPQIAGITGVSGATILGDGRVVLILDMPSLVRQQQPVSDTPSIDADEPTDPLILVVDDSITVRRVTERFLKRHGFEVATARDGMDAVSVIQDQQPAVILLDIEMPRMDGFEFATHVRNDPRFADTPIIMITSRSGEKHRARAIEIGVNDYLGKPYQDHQLLDAIRLQLERS
ncbi:MAG: Hpt domain-containing protein [Pseudomonadota bacterium]